MKIKCLFIVRDRRSGPELLLAWDEYTIAENYEGWTEACKDALKSLRTDYETQRYVYVDIPDEALEAALADVEIPGKVERTDEASMIPAATHAEVAIIDDILADKDDGACPDDECSGGITDGICSHCKDEWAWKQYENEQENA